MNVETIVQYINSYGYFIIFLFLFFGIVGIPAPEETLLFLIGVLIGQHKLGFGLAAISAISGAFCGMLSAYFCGKYVGHPFIRKYGQYVGITDDRWNRVKQKYEKNIRKTIILGFYLPGLRQISPYFAGITKVRFGSFFLYSILGTILWTQPFILAGFFLGQVFHINPEYVPYLGIFLLIIFLMYVLYKYFKKRRSQKQTSN